MKLRASDILYFESVDERVFVYTDEDICEVKTRLYELEKELPDIDFMRAGKSLIINLPGKVKAAKEDLHAIQSILEHAMLMLG